ncbi:MAG TPA: molybdopterin-dependent oxidoreductase [Opitutaceae bacterium]|jgi:hypothetical protein
MKLTALATIFLVLAGGARAAEPVLTVTTPEKTLALSREDFDALPHLEISAFDPHQKVQHRYGGVEMREILGRAGAPLGERMRGRAQQMVVLARSKDNYLVAYALAEFDEAFSDRQVLLADTEDGKPLGEGAGPFRIILPGDKKAARWARMITRIDVRPADPEAPEKLRPHPPETPSAAH